MKTGDKTGNVVGALTVRDTDEIMLITIGGQMVRIPVKDIREAGRNTMGVKLVNLDAGDKLQAIAPVISGATGRSDRRVGAGEVAATQSLMPKWGGGGDSRSSPSSTADIWLARNSASMTEAGYVPVLVCGNVPR